MFHDPLAKFLGCLLEVGLIFCLLNIIYILALQFVENVYSTIIRVADFLRERREKQNRSH